MGFKVIERHPEGNWERVYQFPTLDQAEWTVEKLMAYYENMARARGVAFCPEFRIVYPQEHFEKEVYDAL